MVDAESGGVTVIGGEDPSLGGEVMTGQAGIYYGSATTASTYFFPSATVAAWDAYVASATSQSSSGSSMSVRRPYFLLYFLSVSFYLF